MVVPFTKLSTKKQIILTSKTDQLMTTIGIILFQKQMSLLALV